MSTTVSTISKTYTFTKIVEFSWGSSAQETVEVHMIAGADAQGRRNSVPMVTHMTSTVKVYHGVSLSPSHTQESRLNLADVEQVYGTTNAQEIMRGLRDWDYDRQYS